MRFLFIFVALTMVSAFAASPTIEIKQVARYRSGSSLGTEIVAVHAATARAFLSNSEEGYVDVISFTTPTAPKRLDRFPVPLAAGEDLTSVAVHPSGDYFACVIEKAAPTARGRVELRRSSDGALLKTLEVGIGPDAGVFSHDGRVLLVADEAEEFGLDRATRSFSSPAGAVSRIDLARGPEAATVTEIALPDLTGVAGVTGAGQGRSIEREVDVNGDGRITAPADLNGDGDIEDDNVIVGSFRGVAIHADEAAGEKFIFPLSAATPDLLEPEYIVFSADDQQAFVTMQENNAVVVVDVVGGRVVRGFGLGTTEHAADLVDDDRSIFDGTLRAFREPDGIAISDDGLFLLTGDEGDTDPKVGMMNAGEVTGGGRTMSVFDAATGKLVADTGAQIDEMTAALGFYPDSRSGAKGSEPEMVVAFKVDGTQYAAVGLERANGVALVSLADPTAPRVVGAACADRTAKAGAVAPEGIAYLLGADGGHYLLTANEKDGSLSVYRVSFGR